MFKNFFFLKLLYKFIHFIHFFLIIFMGGINNYKTQNELNSRINILNRQEIEINKELREIQLKLNEIVPEEEKVKVKKYYFDDFDEKKLNLYEKDLREDENNINDNEENRNERIITINKKNINEIQKIKNNKLSKTKKQEIQMKKNIIKQDLYESIKKPEKKKKNYRKDLYEENIIKDSEINKNLKEEDIKILNEKNQNPYIKYENIKQHEDLLSNLSKDLDIQFNFFQRKDEPEDSFLEKNDEENPYFL